MVKEISNIVDSVLPAISIASLTASAFMGRKFGLAIGYDFSSRIASLFGKQHIAEEYNKTSSDYWTLAKKDAFRDLTAAGGFIALAVASNYASKALLAREEPKEESGWCDNIPVLSTLLNYKKTVLSVSALSLPVLFFYNFEYIAENLHNLAKKVSIILLNEVINKIENKQDLIFSLESYDFLANKAKKLGHSPMLVQKYFDLTTNMRTT